MYHIYKDGIFHVNIKAKNPCYMESFEDMCVGALCGGTGQ